MVMDNNALVIRKLMFHMQGRNNKIVPAVVGLTGIGKTAIINRVAKALNRELIYINMAQQNEGDNAIPVPTNLEGDARLIYILNHKLREVIEHPEKEYIVFCDEFVRAQIPVISEWMTMLNERQFQGYNFANNVRFIAAMNPTSAMKGFEQEDYASTEMDDAHAARFTFIYMGVDRYDWIRWAEGYEDGSDKKGPARIHGAVIDFVKNDNNMNLFYGRSNGDIRMRTPRAWEYLSDQLKDLEEMGMLSADASAVDKAFVTSIISDQLGEDCGPLFATNMWDFYENITFEQVMTTKKISKRLVDKFSHYEVNKQSVIMDGLVNRIIEEVKENGAKFTEKEVANFVELFLVLGSNDLKSKIHQNIDNALFVYDKDEDERKRGTVPRLLIDNEAFYADCLARLDLTSK